MYGLSTDPWIQETALAKALQYEEGQEPPEGICEEVVKILNHCEVKSSERKHPQFQANVSSAISLSVVITE